MASSTGSERTGPGGRPRRGPIEGDEASISVAVVEAIAGRQGVCPTEVDFRLDEHVDPDALDALARHARTNAEASWTLEFEVDGHAVTVRSDGRIVVD